MGRIGAFLIHLGISLVIFAVLAYVVVYVWYPDFFFQSDGGWQGIRIIVLVDLVLGPLLTLVVFNRKKPTAELRRDLSIVGTIQAVCLAAGTYVVYSERPLALVYVDGQFFSMSADDYLEAGQAVPDLSAMPGPTPKRVVVDLPDDVFERAKVRRRALQSDKPLRSIVETYQPLVVSKMDLEKEQLGNEWLETREAASGDISEWIAERGGAQSDYAFLPYGARYGYLVAGVDTSDGQILGFLRHPYSMSGEVY